ncbi:multidrug transporter [Senegalia sp. (in: firmicutes)]
MDKLNKEYIELLREDADPSEKFWKLNKRIKEDRQKTGVQLEMSRSRLISNIVSLIVDGAISFENLEEFSDELKETVSYFIGR